MNPKNLRINFSNWKEIQIKWTKAISENKLKENEIELLYALKQLTETNFSNNKKNENLIVSPFLSNQKYLDLLNFLNEKLGIVKNEK